jgi:hypothetical protein
VGTGITGYTVTSSPGGVTGTGASSPVVVSGLTAGTAYTFTVTASTAGGTGPASAASNSVTPTPPVYIEDIYSTYLYTGDGSTQTITNGINLSGNGGLVWIKQRNSSTPNHIWVDSARGNTKAIYSNATSDQYSEAGLTTLTSSGFSVGQVSTSVLNINASGQNYASWSFRKQPKFFDVLTYTGNGTDGRNIAHSLGVMPACIIVKRTDNTSNWSVYHQGNINGSGSGQNTYSLNTTGAANNLFTVDRTSSTNFNVSDAGAGADSCNVNGGTYVAYLFASNAGGFGLTGTDNVISCGSFTTVSSGYSPNVELGYEPQWVMLKRTDSTGAWLVVDTMRGWVDPAGTGANDANLRPNVSDAEATNDIGWPYATGFNAGYRGGAESTWIYIAIRRGPMAVPTVGTSVFAPVAQSTSGSYPRPVVTNFPVDFVIMGDRSSAWGYNWSVQDRLRGNPNVLFTSDTVAENTGALSSFAYNTQFGDGWVTGSTNGIYECMRRAPSFMDVVCYTGNGSGSGQVINHNLGVTPELIIIKSRSGAYQWHVYAAPLGQSTALFLESTSAAQANSAFTGGTINSTQFQLKVDFANVNGSGVTYVSYLFATCAGVSKVGSYTGTGALQTVNCGFTTGARFVLIKRTDSTGDWYTYDSARGITSGDDPYLFLNSTAAEVTGTNYVDTTSVGFQVTAAAPSGLNASGGTYIFLAIA